MDNVYVRGFSTLGTKELVCGEVIAGGRNDLVLLWSEIFRCII